LPNVIYRRRYSKGFERNIWRKFRRKKIGLAKLYSRPVSFGIVLRCTEKMHTNWLLGLAVWQRLNLFLALPAANAGRQRSQLLSIQDKNYRSGRNHGRTEQDKLNHGKTPSLIFSLKSNSYARNSEPCPKRQGSE
jgi:hypothetical protein